MHLSAEIDSKKTYRLLQLTPHLERSLREGNLEFKSSGDGSVVACTNNSTHLVRVLKQTNTLLISQLTNEQNLTAFASPANMLETISVSGTIDWSQIPEYKGRKQLLEAPCNDSSGSPEICCSQQEFLVQCRSKPAAYINGVLYRISTDVVHNILVNLVSSMVETGDMKLETPLESLNLEGDDPKEIVRAVYEKFLITDQESNGLDVDKISHFSGLYLLSKKPEGMSKSEFVSEWRLDMPIRMNTDITSLYGYIVELSPGHSPIVRLMDPSSLPTDAKLRFSRLFSIKTEWPLTEIEPFILSLVPPSQKLDAWVLKYARKKRVNSDIYLVPLRR